MKSAVTHSLLFTFVCAIQQLLEALIRFDGLIKDIKLHSYFVYNQFLQIHMNEIDAVLLLMELMLSYSLQRFFSKLGEGDACTFLQDLPSHAWTNVSIRLLWHKMKYY